jgi:hypothetical protein
MTKLLLSCNLNNVAVHLCCIQEMSKKIVPIFNRKIVETLPKAIPLAHI